MTHRERTMKILHYEKADRMPIVHFGFWDQTYDKFEAEGHIARPVREDGAPAGWDEGAVARLLGFDFGWDACIGGNHSLDPGFEHKLIETRADGGQIYQDGNGAHILQYPNTVSIPAEVGHTLVDRESFEREFRHRLEFSDRRLPKITPELIKQLEASEYPVGLHCGSLYGRFRDIAGFTGTCYILADDEELFFEIIDIFGDLCYRVTERILEAGVRPDFGHFWEDICFKNGPLVNPEVFYGHVGPHYRRITDLLKRHGTDIVSLDCDGMIDSLIPTWVENGVNTMFPIEVGTWGASIAPWRERFGRAVLGVGGMDKRVFAMERADIDREIRRLLELSQLGGYIPCPDHRIPPDAKWENIQYYCEKFSREFERLY